MSSIASLYIPHVFSNINERRIKSTFDFLGLCKVSHVDFVPKMGANGTYNSIYIHIECWYNNVVADNFQERVRNPDKEARIVYDDPWYWIALENTGRKFVSGDRKPCIDVGSVNQPTVYAKNQRSYAYDNADYVEEYEETIDTRYTEECMLDELEDLMDEEEARIKECDGNLITIDGRYVHSMEQSALELQNSLYKSREEMLHWFGETGNLQNQNNLLTDEVYSLKAQLSLLQDKEKDSHWVQCQV